VSSTKKHTALKAKAVAQFEKGGNSYFAPAVLLRPRVFGRHKLRILPPPDRVRVDPRFAAAIVEACRIAAFTRRRSRRSRGRPENVLILALKSSFLRARLGGSRALLVPSGGFFSGASLCVGRHVPTWFDKKKGPPAGRAGGAVRPQACRPLCSRTNLTISRLGPGLRQVAGTLLWLLHSGIAFVLGWPARLGQARVLLLALAIFILDGTREPGFGRAGKFSRPVSSPAPFSRFATSRGHLDRQARIGGLSAFLAPRMCRADMSRSRSSGGRLVWSASRPQPGRGRHGRFRAPFRGGTFNSPGCRSSRGENRGPAALF